MQSVDRSWTHPTDGVHVIYDHFGNPMTLHELQRTRRDSNSREPFDPTRFPGTSLESRLRSRRATQELSATRLRSEQPETRPNIARKRGQRVDSAPLAHVEPLAGRSTLEPAFQAGLVQQ